MRPAPALEERPTALAAVSSEPALAAVQSEAAIAAIRPEVSLGFFPSVQDLAELTKVRVALLVLFTTMAGFILASRFQGAAVDFWLLLSTLLGTFLVAGSASAINQVLEKDRDARMVRTRSRPLPAGRVSPQAATLFGGALAAAGLWILAARTNRVAAAVAAITWGAYVFLYTPLKARTHLSTVVGAVPGALPPLIGWTAAGGILSGPAYGLFGILFFWQLPHFLAIAWLYREDYARGGFPLLAVTDPTGNAVARQSVTSSLALLTVSLLPALTGQSGLGYFWFAFSLGLGFLLSVAWLAISKSRHSARMTVIASIVYLPLLLVAMVMDSLSP